MPGESGDGGDVGAAVEKIGDERAPEIVRREGADAGLPREPAEALQHALRRQPSLRPPARLVGGPAQGPPLRAAHLEPRPPPRPASSRGVAAWLRAPLAPSERT